MTARSDTVDDLENLVKKINEITCPKCESAEVGVFIPAESFNCNECQHEWKEDVDWSHFDPLRLILKVEPNEH